MKDLLWTQDYNTSLGRVSLIALFAQRIFTIVVSLAVFIFAAVLVEDSKVFVVGLVLLASYIAYSIFDEINQRVTKTRWLKYGISKDGIEYTWGKESNQTLFVPFESIVKISFVSYHESKWSTIYFDTFDSSILNDHAFLTEESNHKLCFDNVENGEEVYAMLMSFHKQVKLPKDSIRAPQSRLPVVSPSVFIKLNLVLATTFLFIGLYFIVAAYDFNYSTLNRVDTIITEQVKKRYYDTAFSYDCDTEAGIKFRLGTDVNLIGVPVSLNTTTILGQVKDFQFEESFSRILISPYQGLSLGMVTFGILTLLISSLFIFFKKGRIAREELGVIAGLCFGMLILLRYLI